MLRDAEFNPVALGLKVKLIVQLAPGPSEAPQLLPAQICRRTCR